MADTQDDNNQQGNLAKDMPNSDKQNKSDGEKLPMFEILVQYSKDVSFEAPHLPVILREHKPLKFGMDIDIATQSLGGKDVEVVLTFHAKAEEVDGGRPAYIAEIAYGGVVRLNNVPKEAVASLLLIEVPHQLYPSVRAQFMNLVREGGFTPPMLRPINFLELAKAKAAKEPKN